MTSGLSHGDDSDRLDALDAGRAALGANDHPRASDFPPRWVRAAIGGDLLIWVNLADPFALKILRGNTRRGTLLESICKRLHPGGLCVEAGAHSGWFSLHVADRYRQLGSGHVVALEPQAEVAGYLERSARQSGLGSYLTVLTAAAGEAPGAALVARHGYKFCSAIVREAASDARDAIPRVTIDEIVNDRRTDVLIIDVEGAEMGVAKGAERTILRDRPLIVCGANHRRYVSVGKTTIEEFVAMFRDWGYAAKMLLVDRTIAPFDPVDARLDKVMLLMFEP